MSDYFTVPTTVYLYMTSGSYSISTRQVSFPLQTNLTLFSLNPTSTLVTNQLNIPSTAMCQPEDNAECVAIYPIPLRNENREPFVPT